MDLDLSVQQKARLVSCEADAVRAVIAETGERAIVATIAVSLLGGGLRTRALDDAIDRLTAEDATVRDLRRALAAWVVYGTPTPIESIRERWQEAQRAHGRDVAAGVERSHARLRLDSLEAARGGFAAYAAKIEGEVRS